MIAKWIRTLGVATAIVLAATGSSERFGQAAGVIVFTLGVSLLLWEAMRK